MADPREEVEALLEEKPEFEEHLRAVLEVDEEHEAWIFDDVPLDSGAFGELVSRGVATETEDGDYELAESGAVAAVLEGDSDAVVVEDDEGRWLPSPGELSLPAVDRREATAVAAVVALLVVFRLVPYSSVFRGGDVVLSGNDPYVYRYLVAETLARASGPLDVGVLTRLPNPNGEPLLVAALWWASELLGGGETAAGLVMAWYPVATAAVTGVVLYVFAVRLTDDVRVGLASVALLAVTPVHALRTAVGFADHHALDYLLLSVTALLVLVLASRDRTGPRTWAIAGALGAAVAAQTLAWEAGPLLLAPIGVYLAVAALADLREGASPLVAHGPLLAGLGLGGVLTALVHAGLGWHTQAVAFSPLLLFSGAVGVVVTAEVVQRRDGTVEQLVGIEGTIAVVGLVVASVVVPGFWGTATSGLGFILGTTGVLETRTMFADSLGGTFGPVLQFGFLFVVAMPHMAWLVLRVYRGQDATWLVPLSYGWVFLPLAVVQIRFAPQFALFASVFGGVAFVHLAAWVDLGEPPVQFRNSGGSPGRAGGESLVVEDRRRLLRLAGLSLGVGGLGALLAAVQHSGITTDREEYRAAVFIREFAAEREMEYPENYVFSKWGKNRLYNWFVNGESRSYRYAKENYERFLGSRSPARWYRRLADRAGFVVVTPEESTDPPEDSVYNRLVVEWGQETGHYRVLWTDEAQELKVYELVQGAIVAGRVPGGETASVATHVDLENADVTYENTTTATRDGWAGVRVPHPGRYTVGETTVTVTEADVREGGFAGERTGAAHWRLDEDGGQFVFDAVGGHHGRVVDLTWTERVDGRALEATGEGYALVAHDDAIDGADGLTLAAWVRADDDTDFRTDRTAVRIAAKDESDGPTDGYRIGLSGGRASAGLGDGDATASLSGPHVDDGGWHHLALTWDGATARLYLDGERVDTADYDGTIANEQPLGIAAAADGGARFVGAIDELRFRNEPVEAATVERWASDDAGETPTSE